MIRCFGLVDDRGDNRTIADAAASVEFTTADRPGERVGGVL